MPDARRLSQTKMSNSIFERDDCREADILCKADKYITFDVKQEKRHSNE
jgi:hypothetical protein